MDLDSNTLLIVVGLWIVCGIASLLIVQSKGSGDATWGFLLGLLLGPLGVLLALVSKPAEPVAFTPSSPAATAEKQPIPELVLILIALFVGAIALVVILVYKGVL